LGHQRGNKKGKKKKGNGGGAQRVRSFPRVQKKSRDSAPFAKQEKERKGESQYLGERGLDQKGEIPGEKGKNTRKDLYTTGFVPRRGGEEGRKAPPKSLVCLLPIEKEKKKKEKGGEKKKKESSQLPCRIVPESA